MMTIIKIAGFMVKFVNILNFAFILLTDSKTKRKAKMQPIVGTIPMWKRALLKIVKFFMHMLSVKNPLNLRKNITESRI